MAIQEFKARQRLPHRPGPWQRMGDGSGGLTLYIVDDDGDEVARVRGWGGDPDDSESTADLITAAPDLLLAMQRVAAYLSIHDSDYWEGNEDANKARAAIRKATGN